MGKHVEVRRARGVGGSGNGTWIRRGVVVGALALGAGMLVGVSGASSPSVDVGFTPLTPPKVVLKGTVNASGIKLVAVSGGSTTVPTNATTIQMTVVATGTAVGSLTVHPAGNPAGSSGQSVTWTAGGSGTATIATDVGQQNKVAFVNSSAAKAKVTATITGYSTEVEADDVSSIGGTTGQVLTDTGSGAAWQDSQLPSAYFTRNSGTAALPLSTTITVGSLTVPAGRYQVQASVSVYNGGGPTSGYFRCDLITPGGATLGTRFGNVSSTIFNTTLTFEGLVQTTGGTISLTCSLSVGAVNGAYERTILASSVGSTTGPILSKSTHRSPAPHQAGR